MIIAGATGERTVEADQFFTGIMTTALADGEILVAIEVPVAARGQGSAYEKFSHPASRYAVVGAAALVTIENDSCTAAQVALGGLLPNARRAPTVERALTGKPSTAETFAAAAQSVAADRCDVPSTLRVAEYRAAMARARQAGAGRGRRARETRLVNPTHAGKPRSRPASTQLQEACPPGSTRGRGPRLDLPCLRLKRALFWGRTGLRQDRGRQSPRRDARCGAHPAEC